MTDDRLSDEQVADIRDENDNSPRREPYLTWALNEVLRLRVALKASVESGHTLDVWNDELQAQLAVVVRAGKSMVRQWEAHSCRVAVEQGTDQDELYFVGEWNQVMNSLAGLPGQTCEEARNEPITTHSHPPGSLPIDYAKKEPVMTDRLSEEQVREWMDEARTFGPAPAEAILQLADEVLRQWEELAECKGAYAEMFAEKREVVAQLAAVTAERDTLLAERQAWESTGDAALGDLAEIQAQLAAVVEAMTPTMYIAGGRYRKHCLRCDIWWKPGEKHQHRDGCPLKGMESEDGRVKSKAVIFIREMEDRSVCLSGVGHGNAADVALRMRHAETAHSPTFRAARTRRVRNADQHTT